MKAKQILWATALVCGCYLFMSESAMAFPPQEPLVRLAELDIDPAQLDAYKAALKEEIAASIRLEPGVLRLYAVSIKDHPNPEIVSTSYSPNPQSAPARSDPSPASCASTRSNLAYPGSQRARGTSRSARRPFQPGSKPRAP